MGVGSAGFSAGIEELGAFGVGHPGRFTSVCLAYQGSQSRRNLSPGSVSGR